VQPKTGAKPKHKQFEPIMSLIVVESPSSQVEYSNKPHEPSSTFALLSKLHACESVQPTIKGDPAHEQSLTITSFIVFESPSSQEEFGCAPHDPSFKVAALL
jgi:hypothetical protein